MDSWCLNCDRFEQEGSHEWFLRYVWVGWSCVADTPRVGPFGLDFAFLPEWESVRVGAYIVIACGVVIQVSLLVMSVVGSPTSCNAVHSSLRCPPHLHMLAGQVVLVL